MTREHRRRQRPQRNTASPKQARAPADKTTAEAAAHASWDCFFRHLQRLRSLSTLSLQRCGLEDRDVRSLSVSLQILPADRLRCLRLNGNCVGLSGLRMLLTALTSRRMRLPALWLRGQRPALSESGAMGIVEEAFRDGLFAEVRGWTGDGELGVAWGVGSGPSTPSIYWVKEVYICFTRWKRTAPFVSSKISRNTLVKADIFNKQQSRFFCFSWESCSKQYHPFRAIRTAVPNVGGAKLVRRDVW